METQKQKTAITIIIAAVVVLIAIIIIVYAVSKKAEPEKKSNPFADCQVLSSSCKDKNCEFLFLCNETEFSDCQVYDCGKNYGIRIIDKAGNVQNKTREKTSPCENEEVREMIAKCSGSFEVIEKNNCENGEAKVKVKINTKGDCKINSAVMSIGGKSRIANVEQSGEFYNISVKSCGEISDIKITGEGGVMISEKMEMPEDMMPRDMFEEAEM